MRALLPTEREALLLAGCKRPIDGEAMRVAVESCVALGRLRWVPAPLPGRPSRIGTEVTDLGRLALRVSVPGASVLP